MEARQCPAGLCRGSGPRVLPTQIVEREALDEGRGDDPERLVDRDETSRRQVRRDALVRGDGGPGGVERVHLHDDAVGVADADPATARLIDDGIEVGVTPPSFSDTRQVAVGLVQRENQPVLAVVGEDEVRAAAQLVELVVRRDGIGRRVHRPCLASAVGDEDASDGRRVRLVAHVRDARRVDFVPRRSQERADPFAVEQRPQGGQPRVVANE